MGFGRPAGCTSGGLGHQRQEQHRGQYVGSQGTPRRQPPQFADPQTEGIPYEASEPAADEVDRYPLVLACLLLLACRMALIQSLKLCPPDLQESVVTVIYAAARTEIPELMKVRKMFKAKYGDKLSSVLDIVYRKPKTFTTRVDLNLLGGSFTSEGISNDEKFSAIVGLRYRDNSLLVDARETQTLYDPKFFDTQAYLNYSINEKISIGFLGNITTNNYNYRPQTRKTNFGTIDNPMALLIFYEGQERDKYSTYFGATNFNYKINDALILKFISSLFFVIMHYGIALNFSTFKIDVFSGHNSKIK